MKILVYPVLLTLLPLLVLLVLLYRWRLKNFSTNVKAIVAVCYFVVTSTAALVSSYISLTGIGEKGIKCGTGVITFLFLGAVTFAVGIIFLFPANNKPANN
jgi:hypothetical protein